MDDNMKQKIQKVLDRVKDPVSGLPVVELDLIRKVRHVEEENELRIFTNFPDGQKKCFNCVGIQTIMVDGIVRQLREAFEAEFPEMTIGFAD